MYAEIAKRFKELKGIEHEIESNRDAIKILTSALEETKKEMEASFDRSIEKLLNQKKEQLASMVDDVRIAISEIHKLYCKIEQLNSKFDTHIRGHQKNMSAKENKI
jgi:division protein CdvB (Snf7/Vps24/ESCRT-III family)